MSEWQRGEQWVLSEPEGTPQTLEAMQEALFLQYAVREGARLGLYTTFSFDGRQVGVSCTRGLARDEAGEEAAKYWLTFDMGSELEPAQVSYTTLGYPRYVANEAEQDTARMYLDQVIRTADDSASPRLDWLRKAWLQSLDSLGDGEAVIQQLLQTLPEEDRSKVELDELFDWQDRFEDGSTISVQWHTKTPARQHAFLEAQTLRITDANGLVHQYMRQQGGPDVITHSELGSSSRSNMLSSPEERQLRLLAALQNIYEQAQAKRRQQGT